MLQVVMSWYHVTRIQIGVYLQKSIQSVHYSVCYSVLFSGIQHY